MLYGIWIAEKVGFPPIIIETARKEANGFLEEATDDAVNDENTLGAERNSKMQNLFKQKIQCLIENWTGKVESLKLLLEALNKQKDEGDLSWALEPFELHNDKADSIAVQNDKDKTNGQKR